MRNERQLWNLIWQWTRITDRARALGKDRDRRKKSARNGVFAIVYAVLTAACACALLTFGWIGRGFFATVAGILLGVAIGCAGTLVSLVTTAVFWGCQLWLNRSPFTFISLAVILAVLAAAAALVVVML